MKSRTITIGLSAALLLGASLTYAVENKAVETGGTSSKAPAVTNSTSSKSTEADKKEVAAKRQAGAKIKLVDINSAKKAELSKLPGVSAADADKIIAGRPYGTKAWLLTHQILSDSTYEGVKGLVIAKQPSNDAGKNAAQFAPKNKK